MVRPRNMDRTSRERAITQLRVRPLRTGAVNARQAARHARSKRERRALTAPSTAAPFLAVMAAWITAARPDVGSLASPRQRIEIYGAIPGPKVRRSVVRSRLLGGVDPPDFPQCGTRSATRKPWCERPQSCEVRATLRRRRRGRSHHGLLSVHRLRGAQTGGTERRPFTSIPQRTFRACWTSLGASTLKTRLSRGADHEQPQNG